MWVSYECKLLIEDGVGGGGFWRFTNGRDSGKPLSKEWYTDYGGKEDCYYAMDRRRRISIRSNLSKRVKLKLSLYMPGR